MMGGSFQNNKAKYQILKAIEIKKTYPAPFRKIKNKRHHKSVLPKSDKPNSSEH